MNSKILLIFPPSIRPNRPYLSIPLLVGQLKNKGFDAAGLDLNLEFYSDILSKEYILKTKLLMENIAKITDHNDMPDGFLQKQEIIKKYLEHPEYIDKLITQVDVAVKTLKSKKDFYNPQLLRNAHEIINQVVIFLSLPYYPSKCTSDPITYNFKLNYKEIKDYCFDKNQNIFIEYFEKKIDEIIANDLDLIGISVPFDSFIPIALTLSRLLKEKTNAHITIGGQAISYNSDAILKYPEFFDIFCDSVLTGAGESSIVELANYIENKTDIENVSGLIYKTGQDDIKKNPVKQITSMDNIANISLDGLNLDKYYTPDILMPIIFSKGCPWGKCIFCSFPHDRQVYCIKKVDKIIDEIEELNKKHKLKFFRFHDDCIPPAFYEKLADEIIKRKLDIKYSSFGRLDKGFTKKLLKKLYKSGLRFIFWGLESGSERILKQMNKGIDIKYASQVLKNSHDAGIYNHASLIIGFPSESEEDFRHTYDFCEANRKYIDSYGAGKFGLQAHSAIYTMQEQFGITENINEEFSFCKEYKSTNISEEEINRRLKLIYDNFPIVEIDFLYILKYGNNLYKLINKFHSIRSKYCIKKPK